MKIYPFAKYSFLSTLRNLRRTLFSIIGILIAISLIAGEGISIDSSVAQMIEKELDKIPYEFYGSANQYLNSSAIANLKSTINAQPNVIATSVVLVAEVGVGNYSTSDSAQIYAMAYGIDDTYIEKQSKFSIEGKIVVGNGSATLSDGLAGLLNLSVGRQITITLNNFTKVLNVSGIVKVNAIGTGSERPSAGKPGQIYSSPVIYLGINDAFELAPHILEPKFEIYIWADRSKIVSPGDIDATNFNLKRMERNLNNAIGDYGVSITYNPTITAVITGVQMMLLFVRFLLIGLSLPVIILGIYLGTLGSELNYAERRREIGILKARGASDLTIFTLLLGEALFYGVIAGICGLVIGVLVSRMLFSASLALFGNTNSIVGFEVSTATLAISVILAVMLSLFASYKSARRVSKLSVSEALRSYTSEEAIIQYKPKIDIIMVVLALITYAAMIAITEISKHPEAYDFQVFVTLLCLSAIFILLVPLAPFFLIIGLSRLVTRSSPKIYEYISTITTPLLKDMVSILKKNIKRNPRRASTVCMLISLALAFGLFVSVTYDSQVHYDERVVLADIGADIKIECFPQTGINLSALQENISELQGVCASAQSRLFEADINGIYYIATVNAGSYWKVAHLDNSMFIEGNVDALKTLDTKSIIVTEHFAKNGGYALHDTVRIFYNNQSKIYTISAIVKYLPGYGATPVADLYVNEAGIENVSVIQYFLFLDVEDKETVACAEYIRENYGGEVSVYVYSEELTKRKEDPLSASIYNFLNIEFGFAILITAAGIAMIMLMAVLERKQEIANMVVRGASFGQVAKLIWGEGITVSFVGLLLGLGTGALTAYVFNRLFDLTTASSPIARDVVFGYTSLIIVLVAVLVLIVTTLVVVLPLKKLKLGEILRWRGG